MPQRKKEKRKIGIEGIIEPGIGAIYIRGAWMKKLDDLGKRKKRSIERGKP